MASIELLTDDLALNPVNLPSVLLAEDVSEGEPKRIVIKNSGDSTIFELVISVEGEGKKHIQFARDEDGASGIWAAPGESVIAFSGSLPPGGEAPFWARGIFLLDDLEREFPARLVVGTLSG